MLYYVVTIIITALLFSSRKQQLNAHTNFGMVGGEKKKPKYPNNFLSEYELNGHYDGTDDAQRTMPAHY